MSQRILLCLFILLSTFSFSGRAVAEEGEPERIALENFKPIYFLYGNPYSKIQLSFKTRLINDVPFYFGYSQIMMWDLGIANPYFYDLNYNPLLWYRFNFYNGRQQWIDVIPWEHESNGRGIDGEHSWDRVGAAYHQENTMTEHIKLYSDVKAWVPVNYNSSNADLAQYRGVWELNFTLTRFFDGPLDFDDLVFRIYPGGPSFTDPFHGGQELTLRMNGTHRKFLPLFVLQVFHGYGEDLRDYMDNHWELRAGIGF